MLALLISAAFTILLIAVDSQRHAAQLSRHSQLVLSTANELERLTVDLETGERGFVLTGESQFLAPWTAARAAFPATGRRLEQLVGLPDQQERADRVVEAIRSYINDYSVPLVDAARLGDPEAKRPAIIEEGKRRIDIIRDEFADLEEREEQLGEERDQRARSAAHRARIAGVVSIAGSVVLIIVFAAYLARAIIYPIRRAAGMAARLAAGDLSARMAETGIGEIGTLERTFNTMGTSLERNQNAVARLADEQAALRRVATFVARGVAPSEVVGLVAEEVGRQFGADGVWILRYELDTTATIVANWGATDHWSPPGTTIPLDGFDIATEVLRTGESFRMDDLGRAPGSLAAAMRDLGVQSAAGAPIVVEGRVWGVMVVMSRQTDPLFEVTEARFIDFTDLVATAIANTAARTELAASRARVVEAIDRSRRGIERDLHDGTQQRLVSLALDLRSIEARVPDDPPELRAEVAEVATGLSDALDELREIARGIHPAILSEGGLRSALRALARRSAVPVELDVRVGGRLAPRIEVAAYYVVAEALTNTAKHAAAELVRVRVGVSDGWLWLTISDDGIGGADPDGGTGLIGLVDRVAALDGSITVDSAPGQGTTLRVALPAERPTD